MRELIGHQADMYLNVTTAMNDVYYQSWLRVSRP